MGFWFTFSGPAQVVAVGPTYHFPLPLSVASAMTGIHPLELRRLWIEAAKRASTTGPGFKLPEHLPTEYSEAVDLDRSLTRLVAIDWDMFASAQGSLHPDLRGEDTARVVVLASIAYARSKGRTVLNADGTPWDYKARRLIDGRRVKVVEDDRAPRN